MANSETIKSMNVKKVYDVLREKESISKTDIAKKVGLTFPTVSTIIEELIQDGEVIEDGIKGSDGGRCSKKYKLNPMYAVILLIYLEGNTLNWIVKDFSENTLKAKKVIVKDKIIDEIDKVISLIKPEFSNLGSIVIGIASNVDNGKVFSHMEYNELKYVDITSYFSNRYNVLVNVQNDMNVAISGYWYRHEKKNKKVIINIYLGDNGIGSGMIINGELWRGANNFAGELHYLPICDNNISYSKNGFNNVNIVEYYGKIIQSYVALINPELIILYNNLYVESKFEDIVAYCRENIPKGVIPELILSNEFINDYQYGLTKIGIDLINGKNKH